ncbi:MAG: hypothetical protein GW941_00110 [Candidatus Pacebacteria bacterium]|nr:hypothetical protein [Candidatus Paceibacterota bacterium]NCQ65904.1 hypothetical protein [Candidatus Paceibacterota bacterium]NCS87012.1 hypothetical protein [Candidatus Paceibacterota bacterium]
MQEPEADGHMCQDDGKGKCQVCGDLMPINEKLEKDHYFQDRGDGKCIICGEGQH